MLPRPRRRRLLLPPGWMALGCLLPLSCWLLGRQPKQWRQENMLSMTMLPLRPDTSSLRVSRPYTASTEYNPWVEADGPQLRAKIARLRPWRNFALLGETAADAACLLSIEAAVKAIQADTGHAGGVRVRMRPQVSYRSLVALLDMMDRLKQRKYWLDIAHRPTTFYAITPRPLTLAERRELLTPVWVCGGGTGFQLLPSPESKLASLREPARRPPLLLTLATAALLLPALVGTLAVALGTRH